MTTKNEGSGAGAAPPPVKCGVQWIDCSGAPTPDTNDAIGYAVLVRDGRRFAVCAEHAKLIGNARTHAGDCNHVTQFSGTWSFESFG